MKKWQVALELRKQGHLKESNAILFLLAEEYSQDAMIHYQCAWSFDVMGEEARAVPYYEKAIELGLSDKDLEGAYIGLGSTYRTLGDYEKSKRIFERGHREFPENRALQIFYAMTMYNLKEYKQAMEVLLTCLTETTTDSNIRNYQQAIEFYTHQLDRVWK